MMKNLFKYILGIFIGSIAFIIIDDVYASTLLPKVTSGSCELESGFYSEPDGISYLIAHCNSNASFYVGYPIGSTFNTCSSSEGCTYITSVSGYDYGVSTGIGMLSSKITGTILSNYTYASIKGLGLFIPDNQKEIFKSTEYFYDNNSRISATPVITVSYPGTYVFTFKLSILIGNQSPTVQSSYNSYQTNEKLDTINGSVNNVDETIKDQTDTIKDADTSGASDTAGGFFDNFEDDDFGLSDIITAPLNTIKSITSATCSPLTFPLPFVDTQMSLPCMTEVYSQFGSILSIYQTITFGMIAYWIVVNIFATVRNFKNPDTDEIEVMSL